MSAISEKSNDTFRELEEKRDKIKEERNTDTRKRGGDNIKLERVKMPEFDGNIRDYPRFKSDFKKQVLPNINDEDSAAYVLTSCLRGKPLDIVRNVSDDLSDIWERLDEVYGRTSTLADVVMNDIRRLRIVNEDDDRRFIELVDTLESGYRDLKRVNIQSEIANTTTVSLVEEKLPKSIKREWSKLVNENKADIEGAEKFPKLLEFLKIKKRAIEYETADLRAGVLHTRGSLNYGDGASFSPANRCLLHNAEKHSTESCRAFLGMTVEDRYKLLSEKRACWNCLKMGHRASTCWSEKRCSEENCGKLHHVTLHQVAEGETLHQIGMRSSPCLLQIMAIPTATNSNKPVNVVWDGGANLSMITFRKAKELCLKGKPTTLSITKVGGTTDTTPSLVYSLPLLAIDGSLHAVQVFGIDEISREIKPVDTKCVTPLFTNVHERDIGRPTGSVDVLIGIENAALHPTRQQINGNLILMKNQFGLCLGGSHPLLQEFTTQDIDSVFVIHHASVKLDDFFETEGLGVECNLRCGGCKCGECATGSRSFSIREEHELKLIENGLDFKGSYWEASYPWIKDPNTLHDNRIAAEGMLKSTERRLLRE